MSYYEYLQTFSILVVSIQLLFGVFRWIYGNVIGPNFLEPTNFQRYGKWALVTGATDGIGKQYAISLAKRGLNIILVSRTLTKLEGIAKEISENYNVETQVIAVNFTSGPEIYDHIKQQIVGKEIGILVNNVGMAYPAPEPFLKVPDRDTVIQDLIKCNITSVTMMCSVILPQMVQRKLGLIINISSISSLLPAPTMCVYSASKAFVTKFSADLATEYESHGVEVHGMVTAGVATNMSRLEGGSFTTPTPNQYVESALRFVGHARITTGFHAHSMMLITFQFMNFIAPSTTAALFTKIMAGMRAKQIKDGSYVPIN